jgi:DMSO/TMAO reductase YedYZ molybdopterin-dependent catalytic subunit
MADEDDVTLSGKLKDKLIDSKQKWAADGRLLTGKTAAHSERLPPGQRRVENWPVLDLGIQPEIPLHAWRLFVDGDVENPVTLKWDAFTNLPKVTLTTDIHCVTAWSRYDNVGRRFCAHPDRPGQAQGRRAARHLPLLRHLQDQRAAGGFRR